MTLAAQTLLRLAFVKVQLDLTMPETPEITSEFAAPRWSIINADGIVASNLAYHEAAQRLREMADDSSGLCIVTDTAAQRLRGENVDHKNAPHELPAPEKFSETL